MSQGINNIYCGFGRLCKNSKVRQFIQRCSGRRQHMHIDSKQQQTFTQAEIDSLLLSKDKETNRYKLGERRRLRVTLDVDGNIMRYHVDMSESSSVVPQKMTSLMVMDDIMVRAQTPMLNVEYTTDEPESEKGNTRRSTVTRKSFHKGTHVEAFETTEAPANNALEEQDNVPEIDPFAIESGLQEIGKYNKELFFKKKSEPQHDIARDSGLMLLVVSPRHVTPAGNNRDFIHNLQQFLLPGFEVFDITQESVIEWLPYIKLNFVLPNSTRKNVQTTAAPNTIVIFFFFLSKRDVVNQSSLLLFYQTHIHICLISQPAIEQTQQKSIVISATNDDAGAEQDDNVRENSSSGIEDLTIGVPLAEPHKPATTASPLPRISTSGQQQSPISNPEVTPERQAIIEEQQNMYNLIQKENKKKSTQHKQNDEQVN
ncbi:hypothetical protein RFI_04347 [Reticulomyxa filosa]|uniref:Uncharacterized protein n=1 Tax=Reticulomyxa filosa TaxID=46433 RepID=X6P3R4_RETFI|nr:hypothetical protein RFI_04347 [Reticulomyxa filosa]|eukprot:ETO32768.1 hypothetical protein RFI_04347 [Reticulomyxa filosa]